MAKSILLSLVVFIGCSQFTFNASMCEQVASDPHATIPKECRNYNEQEAEKAFNKTKHDQKQSTEEIIEFNKDK
ncbi:hypothetical protein KJ877_01660 [bacterium]|nr:hypothetical protein [bacterium]MBU1989970.1 hypothetical protein [bacterium]